MDTRGASECRWQPGREDHAPERHERRWFGREVRWAGLAVLTMVAAGCGGGGRSTGPSGTPVISALAGRFAGGPCTLASGARGTSRLLSITYADDGNLSGGTVQVVASFEPSSTSPISVSFAIPSANVQITGTTAGTIMVGACARFGSATTLTETVTVVDAAGNASNTLAITTARPAGLPQLPRDSAGPGYGR